MKLLMDPSQTTSRNSKKQEKKREKKKGKKISKDSRPETQGTGDILEKVLAPATCCLYPAFMCSLRYMTKCSGQQ